MNMPQPGLNPHRGILILVLGILSIVLCQLLGPFAWLMGKADMAKMDAGMMDPAGRDTTKAGVICGIIGTVLLVLSILFTILWIVLVVILGIGAAAAGAAGTPY